MITAARVQEVTRHETVRQLVQRHLDDGASVIWVSFNRPYEALKRSMGTQPALMYIDATGSNPTGLKFLDDACFVESPVLLEVIALRMRLLRRRMPEARIVLDSASQIALYTGMAQMAEFVHHLANDCRRDGVPLDIIVAGLEHEKILGRIQSFVDQEVVV